MVNEAKDPFVDPKNSRLIRNSTFITRKNIIHQLVSSIGVSVDRPSSDEQESPTCGIHVVHGTHSVEVNAAHLENRDLQTEKNLIIRNEMHSSLL
jgi:hypothetical protein